MAPRPPPARRGRGGHHGRRQTYRTAPATISAWRRDGGPAAHGPAARCAPMPPAAPPCASGSTGCPTTTRPLKAVIRAGVFELGGRPATASLTLPVRERPAVGVHPRFGANGVPDASEAVFDLIMLDPEGKRCRIPRLCPLSRGMDVSVVPAQRRLGLRGPGDRQAAFRRHHRGRCRDALRAVPEGRLRPLSAGGVQSPSSARHQPALPRRLVHRGVGRRSAGHLEVVADHATYRPGEMAKLHIKPPFDGDVLLAVANDKLVETYNMYVPASGATVEIPFRESWGIGAYVLATAFREDTAERGPGRAVGLTWLGLDTRPRTLSLAIESPGDVRPSAPVEIGVTGDGLEAGKPAFVTLAAVDEGVLQLTGFETPDPANHFYGKRRLGVAMRDLYGRLIEDKTARRGVVRSGGGDPRLANRGAPPADVRIVSLFSGLVTLDERGVLTSSSTCPTHRPASPDGRSPSTPTGVRPEGVLWSRPLVPRFPCPSSWRWRRKSQDPDPRKPAPAAGRVSAAFRPRVGGPGLRGAVPKSSTRAPPPPPSRSRAWRRKPHHRHGSNWPEGFKVERRWTVGVRAAQSGDPTAGQAAAAGRAGGLCPGCPRWLVPGPANCCCRSARARPRAAGLLRALDRYPYGSSTDGQPRVAAALCGRCRGGGAAGTTADKRAASTRRFPACSNAAPDAASIVGSLRGADLCFPPMPSTSRRGQAKTYRVPPRLSGRPAMAGERVRQAIARRRPISPASPYAHYSWLRRGSAIRPRSAISPNGPPSASRPPWRGSRWRRGWRCVGERNAPAAVRQGACRM